MGLARSYGAGLSGVYICVEAPTRADFVRSGKGPLRSYISWVKSSLRAQANDQQGSRRDNESSGHGSVQGALVW